jgi:hypothetical protein
MCFPQSGVCSSFGLCGKNEDKEGAEVSWLSPKQRRWAIGNKIWYAVSIAMVVRQKRLEGRRQRVFPVYENVFLLRASSFNDARRQAERIGRGDEEREGVTWNGVPAEVAYGGVRKITMCAPNPRLRGPSEVVRMHSGVEAVYSLFVVKSEANLRKFIRGAKVPIVYEV